MVKLRMSLCISCCLLLFLPAAPGAQSDAERQAWDRVAQAVGKKGSLSPDGVYKVTFPRPNLGVMLNGFRLPAGIGLTSWAAFTRLPGGKHLLMGDIVLLPAEINPVIDALRAGGVEVVAIHNHMAGEQPKIYFMHYQGVGEAEVLARTVRRALGKLTPGKEASSPM